MADQPATYTDDSTFSYPNASGGLDLQGAGILSEDCLSGTTYTLVYTMRAMQNGTTIVYWENDSTPDFTGTGPHAPGGVLTDIGVETLEVRV